MVSTSSCWPQSAQDAKRGALPSSQPILLVRCRRVYIRNATKMVERVNRLTFRASSSSRWEAGSSKFGVTPGGGAAMPLPPGLPMTLTQSPPVIVNLSLSPPCCCRGDVERGFSRRARRKRCSENAPTRSDGQPAKTAITIIRAPHGFPHPNYPWHFAFHPSAGAPPLQRSFVGACRLVAGLRYRSYCFFRASAPLRSQ